MCGRVEFTPGDWIDQDSSGTQLIVAGHVFEFGVTIETPVVEAALSCVPDGTKVEPTAYLVIDGGTPATP
jgi:hypothetical protein